MQTNARQCYTVVFVTVVSNIRFLLYTFSLLAMLITSASAQHNDWEISLNGEREIENASLQGLTGDLLMIESPAYTGNVHVDSLVRLQRGRTYAVPSLIVGSIIGGAIGYYIGNQSETRTDQYGYSSSSSGMSGGMKGSFIGVCAGGVFGGVTGAFSGKEVYKVLKQNPVERRATLRGILLREGRTVATEASSPRDIVYLKNGSTVRGTMLELIPDSTVKILTADSSVFVFRVSEVERMTTEPPVEQYVASPQMAQKEPMDQRSFAPKPLSFTVHGGVGIPVGELGKTTGTTAGLANTGFIVGADLNYMLGDIASWVTSLDFSFHGIDETALGVPTSISRDIGSWLLVWPVTGIRITPVGSSDVRPYAQVQVGLLAGSSPSMSFSNGTDQVTQSSASGTSMAFSAGVGVHVGRKVSIGARYFYGEPEYEISLTSPSLSGRFKYKQPTSVIALVLGITP